MLTEGDFLFLLSLADLFISSFDSAFFIVLCKDFARVLNTRSWFYGLIPSDVTKSVVFIASQ